jgi:hypothetical protein
LKLLDGRAGLFDYTPNFEISVDKKDVSPWNLKPWKFGW